MRGNCLAKLRRPWKISPNPILLHPLLRKKYTPIWVAFMASEIICHKLNAGHAEQYISSRVNVRRY